jgi:hypothetical protein
MNLTPLPAVSSAVSRSHGIALASGEAALIALPP